MAQDLLGPRPQADVRANVAVRRRRSALLEFKHEHPQLAVEEACFQVGVVPIVHDVQRSDPEVVRENEAIGVVVDTVHDFQLFQLGLRRRETSSTRAQSSDDILERLGRVLNKEARVHTTLVHATNQAWPPPSLQNDIDAPRARAKRGVPLQVHHLLQRYS